MHILTVQVVTSNDLANWPTLFCTAVSFVAEKKTIMHTTEEIKINTVKFFAVVTSASCDLIKNLIQFYASKDFTTFSGLLHF